MKENHGNGKHGPVALVSVIIPVFNGAEHIGRALESVCRQTYPTSHLEVIVVDDGSTDGSAKLAASFTDRLPNLQLLVQPNRGVAAARNLGLSICTGELIAFLDCDDEWLPEKVAAQVGVIRADPTLGLVHCGCVFVDTAGNELKGWSRQSRVDEGDILLEFLCDFFLITSSVMVPRTVIEQVGDFDENLKVGEDNELFLRILRRYRAGCVSESLLRRTVRPDSLSRQDYALDAEIDLETLERFLDCHPDFARAHERRINAHMAEYLFGYGYRLLEDGRVEQARDALRRSLKVRWTSHAARSLLRSYLPTGLARQARTAWR
ncbi:MAG: glycosyltransferase family 2 protein [Wenzhouxiangella sp.]